MFPGDVRHYLNEIRRVLKPAGRGLLTHFILNDESRSMTGRSGTARVFNVPLDGCYTIDAARPEHAIALDEPALRQMYAGAGLTIREPILFGSWPGRPQAISYQDMVIATRGA